MARRTRPSDAGSVERAEDLEEVVRDKRAGWRAGAAKGRRRNRRCGRRLVDALLDHADDAEADG